MLLCEQKEKEKSLSSSFLFGVDAQKKKSFWRS
jgi:hypothetical protein